MVQKSGSIKKRLERFEEARKAIVDELSSTEFVKIGTVYFF